MQPMQAISPHFSGYARVTPSVRLLQGEDRHNSLEQAVREAMPVIENDLDDIVQIDFSTTIAGEDDMYVEHSPDPSRTEGYQDGDKVDFAHILLNYLRGAFTQDLSPEEKKKAMAAAQQGQASGQGITNGWINGRENVGSWIVRRKGQSDAEFVQDAINHASQTYWESTVVDSLQQEVPERKQRFDA